MDNADSTSGHGSKKADHPLLGSTPWVPWLRAFTTEAQKKGLWHYFTGQEQLILAPNPDDYGLGEAHQFETDPEVTFQMPVSSEEVKADDDEVDEEVDPTDILPSSKVTKKFQKITKRKSTLTPDELKAYQLQERRSSRTKSRETLGPEDLTKMLKDTNLDERAKEYQGMGLRDRLALYRHNLEESDKTRVRDQQSLGLLKEWVHESLVTKVDSLKDPYEAFEYLKGQYKRSTIHELERAVDRFDSIHMRNFKNVQSYLNELEATKLDIDEAGGGLCSDETMTLKLIRGLKGIPVYHDFLHYVHMFRDMNTALQDYDYLTSQLLMWEADAKTQRSNSNQGTQRENSSTTNKAKNVRCNECGKLGHYARDCRSKNANAKSSTMVKTSKSVVQTKKPFTKKVVSLAKADADKLTAAINQRMTHRQRQVLGTSSNPSRTTLSTDFSLSLGEKVEERSQNEWLRSFPSRKSFSFGSHCNVPSCNTVTTASQYITGDDWIVDTGATFHMVNDPIWFQDFYSLSQTVNTADGKGQMQVQGGGTVSLDLITDQGPVELVLTTVVYVPDLRCNILSTSLLYEKAGLVFASRRNGMVIQTKTRQDVANAVLVDGLYRLELNGPAATVNKLIDKLDAEEGPTETYELEEEPGLKDMFDAYDEHMRTSPAFRPDMEVPAGVTPPHVVAVVDFSDPVWKWHRRLGHLGLDNMRRLLKVSNGINLTDKQVKSRLGAVCPVCATTRAIVRVPKEPATRRFKKPGDLLHVDTWGRYPVTGWDGTKLMLLVTDDATRYTWCARLKSKDEIPMVLRRVLKKAERSFDFKVRRCRLDNEFAVNGVLKAWMEKHSIEIEPTVSYAHEQNGVAERGHRVERDRAAAMLQEHTLSKRVNDIIKERGEEFMRDTEISEKLWPEAWTHAVWIKNRSPTRALKTKVTPWQALTDHRPDLTRERVWGSRTYVTVPHELRTAATHTKIGSARAWMGYYMGSDSESVYRVWNPDKKKVVRVSTANIDDGEGLDDLHDEDTVNRRVDRPRTDEDSPAEGSDSPDEDDNDDEDPDDAAIQGDDDIPADPDRPADDSDDSQLREVSEDDSDDVLTPRDGSRVSESREDVNVGQSQSRNRTVAGSTHRSRQNSPNFLEPEDEDNLYNNIDEVADDVFGTLNEDMAPRNAAPRDGTTSRFFANPQRTSRRAPPNPTEEEADKDEQQRSEGNAPPLTEGQLQAVYDEAGYDPDDYEVYHTTMSKKRTRRTNSSSPSPSPAPVKKKKVTKASKTAKTPVLAGSTSYSKKTSRVTSPVNSDEEGTTQARLLPQTEVTTRGPVKSGTIGTCDECHKTGKDRSKYNGPNATRICSSCIKRSGKKPNSDRKPRGVPGRRPMPSKCARCFVKGHACDGQRPCSTCIRYKINCKEQDEMTALLVPEENKNLTVTKKQPRCHLCRTNGWPCVRRESGTCSRCRTANVECRPYEGHHESGKCYNCLSENLDCDGKFPFSEPCGPCEEDGRECMAPARRGGIISTHKCTRCNVRGLTCNGEQPCNNCSKMKQPTLRCLRQGEEPKLEQDDCHFCKRKGRACDRRAPCHSCVTNPEQAPSCIVDNEAGGFSTKYWHSGKEDGVTSDPGKRCSICIMRNSRGIACDGNAEKACTPCVEYAIQYSQTHSKDKEKSHLVHCQYNVNDGVTKRFRIQSVAERDPRFIASDLNNEDSDEDIDIYGEVSRAKTREKLMSITFNEYPHPFHSDSSVLISPTVEHGRKGGKAICLLCTTEKALDPEPRTRKAALAGPEAEEWKEAMDDEYQSLIENETWEVVYLPRGCKALSGRWVLKRKLASDGSVARHKARFVVRGFEQVHGIDFDETFASVVKPPSYKLFFALAAQLNWHCHQMDVKTAFLYGDIDEDIYVQPPDGYPESQGRVLKLKKSLYGLKQAPRQWYAKLKDFLESISWRVSDNDPSVFLNDQGLYMTVYVDDINIFGSDLTAIEQVKSQLKARFKMSDLGPCAYYLGMHVDATPGASIALHQSAFVQQLLSRFELNDLRPVSTPMDVSRKLEVNKDSVANIQFTRLYQSMVGSLNYLMTVARPDIAHAVGVVSRYSANPNQRHMDAVRRIYAYLKKFPDLGPRYLTHNRDANTPIELVGYVDSDWAGCQDTRRSTTGWVFLLGGCVIAWASRRQKSVALSTCEAEYIAAAEAAKEAIWLINFIRELNLPGISTDAVTLYIDNNAAMKLTKNPEFHARTKHIELRHHFLREQVLQGTIQMKRIDTKDNLADVFTKALPRATFEGMLEGLRLIQPQDSRLAFREADDS